MRATSEASEASEAMAEGNESDFIVDGLDGGGGVIGYAEWMRRPTPPHPPSQFSNVSSFAILECI